MHTIFLLRMVNERIQQLIRFAEQEPDEPFNIYALALEYVNTQPGQARACFDQLLHSHPTYLPTYYHAAALFAALGERDKATELYQKGIVLAQAQNKQKTLLELQRAQQSFKEEEDEW